jgi:hypothetical protein
MGWAAAESQGPDWNVLQRDLRGGKWVEREIAGARILSCRADRAS